MSQGRALRTFAILLAAAFAFFFLFSLPLGVIAAAKTAAKLVVAFSWWLVPLLAVLTLIVERARRFVETGRDALKASALLALLILVGVSVELSVQTFLPAYLADRSFRSWFEGPLVYAAEVAAWSYPWLATCLWPGRKAKTASGQRSEVGG